MEKVTDLVITETPNAMTIFNNDGMDPLLNQISEEVKKFVPDMTTEKGRKEIISMAYKVSRTKTYIDGMGKDLTIEWTNKVDKVNHERKKSRKFLDNLRDEVRKPVNEWQEREESRVQAHKDNILRLQDFLSMGNEGSSEYFQSCIRTLEKTEINDSWEEFKYQGQEIKEMAVKRLTDQMKLKLKEEREARELEELRKEKLEREKRDREERIANEAANKAKEKEQERAKLLAEKVAREARESLEREEKAKEDAKNAEIIAKKARLDAEESERKRKADAVEAEKRIKYQQVEADKQAKIQAQKEQDDARLKKEAEEKAREEDKKHRGKINSEIVDQLIVISSITKTQAQEIVKGIFLKKVSNVKINY